MRYRGGEKRFGPGAPSSVVWENHTPAGRSTVRRGVEDKAGLLLVRWEMARGMGMGWFHMPNRAFTCSTASTMLRSLAKATSQVRVRRPQSGAT